MRYVASVSAYRRISQFADRRRGFLRILESDLAFRVSPDTFTFLFTFHARIREVRIDSRTSAYARGSRFYRVALVSSTRITIFTRVKMTLRCFELPTRYLLSRYELSLLALRMPCVALLYVTSWNWYIEGAIRVSAASLVIVLNAASKKIYR